MNARRVFVAALVLLATSHLHAQQAALSTTLPAAQRAVQAGHFAEAEGLLRPYLQHNPGSTEAAYLLAYSLLREDKARESLAAYTQAAALRAPTAEDLRNVAQAYVLLGDYPDADKWLKASLRRGPDDADTWYNLGRLRYTQNRFADAVACFQKTLALAPRSGKAENNLGLAYEGLNRPQAAEAAYRQALAWQQADTSTVASEQPMLNLAILLLHRGELAGAQDLLLRAAALAPGNASVHEQLGQLHLRELKFDAAVKELKLAMELEPGRSNLHFLLGQAYKHLGQQGLASAEFAQAARLARLPQE